jgi:predicted amidohydrolase YtcJ
MPWAQAVAVRDGKILAVGSNEEISRHRGQKTDIIDLGGRMVMPGIVDAHVHPAWGGVKDLYQCNFPFTATPDDIATAVEDCVAAQPDSEWIVGGQWTSDFFVNNQMESPRRWLDRVSGDKAVVLTDDSGHNHWANSRALALMGIDRDSPAPSGVRIGREASGGEPNGILEEAATLLRTAVPPWSLEQHVAGAAYSVEQGNRFGVTGMKDASASPVETEAFYRLDQTGRLTMHVAAALYLPSTETKNDLDTKRFVQLREKFRSPHVHTDFVKIFLDGVPTASRTAAMLDPYLPPHAGGDGGHGDLYVEADALAEALTELDALGFTVKIHTAGDAAVRAGLDAIEQARKANGRSGLRHELAHAGFVHPEDIPRFAKLDAVADFCPHIWFPSPIIDSIVGALGDRGRHYWPTRDLLDSGAPMLAGSDWPSAVPDMNPWPGLEALVTRRDPRGDHPGVLWEEQAITLEEAIRLFTLDGARALKLQHTTGSVETGKSADLIVLQENLFEMPASRIGETRVVLTLFEGRPVFTDAALRNEQATAMRLKSPAPGGS